MELSDPVSVLPFVGESYSKRLEKLGIITVEDLLTHAPRRYLDFRNFTNISEASVGQTLTVRGEIVSVTNQYSRKGRQMQIISLKDDTGSIQVIWFNQKYLLSSLTKGTKLAVAGEIMWFSRKKALVSPEYEIINEDKTSIHTGRLVPIYPGTKGISSKWLRARLADCFPKVEESIEEILTDKDLQKFNLDSTKKALKNIHFPDNQEDIISGKRKLAINEFVLLQLEGILRRKERQRTSQAHEIAISEKELENFVQKLPFKLTPSQKRSAHEILNDLSKPYPMNRLLEGDVGAGKTVLAAIVCYACFIRGLQSVLMAPTQILANQHFETLNKLLTPFNIKTTLITANKKANGNKADVFVGTHALISKNNYFETVGAIIIDEQHRFGVGQRNTLVKKTKDGLKSPDVLTMTATPIPRTVARAAYGDLDLSTLDELPSGRKPVTTWVVPNTKRKASEKWIEEKIKSESIQVFIVCPLIEESESEVLKEIKSVKLEYERVKNAFPKRTVGLLHGKLKHQEKQKVLDEFSKGKLDILVSTPVIEVGIDIPNASIMVIEAADRFGLAGLHQLRGRVGRGDKKSYCLLFTENTTEKTIQRLQAIKKAKTGFELAELDLNLRGPGELYGTKQSGFPDLKFASWNEFDLINEASVIANIASIKPSNYRLLYEKLGNLDIKISD